MGLFGNRNWNYHGFNTKTNSWYDENGFDRDGYDEKGFDKKGYDKHRFNGEGIHKKTKTKFDEDGHDVGLFGKRINKKGILLEVKAAYPADVANMPIIRIDYDTEITLSVDRGDTIEIKGKGNRRTVRKYEWLSEFDEGKGIIRIDGIGRHNSGIEIGDKISIKKIRTVKAEKIVLAPLTEIPPIDERYLADALEGVPLIKGDNVRSPYFGGRIPFHVLDVTPVADAVLITQKTVFQIDKEASLQFDLTHHKTASHCNMPIYMGQRFCTNCNTLFDWT
jgi:hypothetical protein